MESLQNIVPEEQMDGHISDAEYKDFQRHLGHRSDEYQDQKLDEDEDDRTSPKRIGTGSKCYGIEYSDGFQYVRFIQEDVIRFDVIEEEQNDDTTCTQEIGSPESVLNLPMSLHKNPSSLTLSSFHSPS